MNICETLPPNTSQRYIFCKSEKSPAIMHPFEKALIQFEQIVSTKVNGKSCRKQSSGTVSLDESGSSDAHVKKTSRRDERHVTGIGNKSSMRETVPNVTSDKVDINSLTLADEVKKGCIKLSLNSFCSSKPSNHEKSETYMKIHSTESDAEKELRIANVKVDNVASTSKYSKHKTSGSVLDVIETITFADDASTTLKHAQRKERSADQNTRKQRKKKIASKFRSYFGDCITVSEDEQERDIIKKTFKRRRKLLSVNSPDSGVSVTNENKILVDMEVFKDIQTAIPESIEDDTCSEIFQIDQMVDKSKEVISNKSTSIQTHLTMDRSLESANIFDEPKEVIHDREIAIKVCSSMSEMSNEDTLDVTIMRSDERNKLIEATRDENDESQNGMHTGNNERQKGAIVKEGSVDISYNGIIMSDFSKPPRVTKRLVVNVPILEMEAEESTNNTLALDMPDIPTSDDELVINEDDVQESKLNLNKVDHVNITKSDKVASNDYLHVQEVVETLVSEVVENENLNLTNMKEVQSEIIVANETNNQNLKLTNIKEEQTEVVVNETIEKILSLTKMRQVQEETIIASDSVDENVNLTNIKEERIDMVANETVDKILSLTKMKKVQKEIIVASETVNENLNLTNIGEVQRETFVNETVDENLNLTNVNEVQTKIQSSPEKVSLNSVCQNDADMNSTLLPTAIQEIEFVAVNKLTSNDELVVQKTTVLEDTSVEKNNPLNIVTQPKLRIRSSAELGSRWCPTPSNPITTVTTFSSVSTITSQDAPIYTTSGTLLTETVPATSAAASLNTMSTRLAQLTKSVLYALSNICQLIKCVRTKKYDCDNYLRIEFQKIAKELNFDNYAEITEVVVRVLNEELALSPPLTLTELLSYSPLLNKLYRNSRRRACGTMSTNETLDQNMYYTWHIKNMSMSLGSLLKQLLILYKQDIKYVAYPKQPQENVSLQNNSQSNSSMNPVAASNQVTSHVSTIPANASLQGQKRLNSHLYQALANTHARQQSSTHSISMHEQRTLPASTAPVPDLLLVHQNVPQAVTQNTRQNIPKTVSQNVSQTIFQNIPQNALQVNYNGVRLPSYPVQSGNITVQNVQSGNITVQNVQSGHTNVQNVQSGHTNIQSVQSAHTNVQNVQSGHINVQNVQLGHINVQNMQSGYMNVQSLQAGHINLQNTQLGRITVQNVQPGRITVQNMQAGHVNVQNTRGCPVNQFVVYRQPPAYNILRGVPLQTSSQNAQSYMPRPMQDQHTGNVSYLVSNGILQNEQVRSKTSTMQTQQNYVLKTSSTQHVQNVSHPRMTNPTNQQISLESMTNSFGVLKYLTDIQKLVLMKQIDYYFRCTTWLLQEFTPTDWSIVTMERNLVLQFHTLLKLLVEKSVKQYLPKNCQGTAVESNVLTNIMIELPKVVKIIVKENEGIQCQVDVPETSQETTNNNQQNLDVIATQSEPEKRNEAVKNKDVSNETVQGSKIFDKHASECVPSQSNVEDPTLNIDVNKSANVENIKEQNVVRTKEIAQDLPMLREEKTHSKNNLQQPNTCLVTVKICPDNDRVIVIDSNNIDTEKSVTKSFMKDAEIRNEDVQVTNTSESANKILKGCEETKNGNMQVIDTTLGKKALEEDEELENGDIQIVSTLVSPNKKFKNNEDTEVFGTFESSNKRLSNEEKNEDIQVDSMLGSSSKRSRKNKENENSDVVSTLECPNKRLRMKEENETIQVDSTSECEELKQNEEIEKVASTSESVDDFFYEVIHLNQSASDFEYIDCIQLEDDHSSPESSKYQIMDVRTISEDTYIEMGDSNIHVDENANDEEIKPCLRCGKPSTVVCGACLAARYCSKRCSNRYWKHHFKDCKPLGIEYSC